jgi:proteasome inhibitor subunit 1 (PI31)
MRMDTAKTEDERGECQRLQSVAVTAEAATSFVTAPTSSTSNTTATFSRSIGEKDLNPFGSVVLGTIESGPTLSSPQGGMLVGPDHGLFADPFFHNNGNNNDDMHHPPFLPGFDVPQPRFDPFGPPIDPYGEIGLTSGGRGGRGGRGRGRGGQRGGRWPGDPDPDHLPPPGWS